MEVPFKSIDFSKFLQQLDIELCVRNTKKMGLTDFVSEIKRMKQYPDFDKLAHLIQHIEAKATEANGLSHIL